MYDGCEVESGMNETTPHISAGANFEQRMVDVAEKAHKTLAYMSEKLMPVQKSAPTKEDAPEKAPVDFSSIPVLNSYNLQLIQIESCLNGILDQVDLVDF